MRKKHIYFALVGVVLLLSACSDNFGGNEHSIRKRSGDEVIFGGSATYDLSGGKKASSRTVYGGFEEGASAEPVYWTEGDDVRVYCPEGSYRVSDYNVDVTGDKVITTSLSRRGESSVSWGDTKKQHTFYAVYPAPAAGSDDLDGNTIITGTIPETQNYAVYRKDGFSHIFTPDMKYAYMVAKTVIPNPNEIGESVYLKFTPMATAIEITLMNNTGRSLNLNRVICSSGTKKIAGSFQADLSSIEVASDGNIEYGIGYPETSIRGAGSNQIEVPLLTGGKSTTLLIGESVTFTVFMLPTDDVSDLKLHIEAVEGEKVGYKTGTFTGITISQKKKTYLRNISISGRPYSQSAWISHLEDNEKLTALSIPAAGGAGSGYKNGSTYFVNDTLRQQNYDIPALWNLGIRCFEFAVDIRENDDLIGQNELISGGSRCGVTLGNAVTDITNQLVAHPDEFAMIILTYQTLGGWNGGTNVERNPAAFMSQVNTFWEKVSDGLAARNSACRTELYDPTKTVGQVRGNLFCIARPTSLHQDYGYVQSQTSKGSSTSYLINTTLESLALPAPHEDIMVIHGWGSLKDKWQQRGFAYRSVRKTTEKSSDPDTKTRPGRPFDVSTMSAGRTGNFIFGYNYVLSGNTPQPNNYTIDPKELNPDFSYDIQAGTSTTTDGAWVQEWARVSNMQKVYWYGFEGGATYESLTDGITQAEYNAGHKAKTAYWAPSYEEKCQRVEETLNMAIGRSEADRTVYINSLCGYYVDPDVNSSYNPCTLTDRNINNENKILSGEMATAGMAGNIRDFAADMNNVFSQMLQTKTHNTSVGPMGIIMMDRVGEAESSKRIPQIIIANNFQFALNTSIDMRISSEEINESKGDVIAAPQRRSASDENEEMTIVWE